jgi:hypothetical protein
MTNAEIEAVLTNPCHANLMQTRERVEKIIKDKSVLIIGAAPSAENLTAGFVKQFDLIVRLNNYRNFDWCPRTDIFYSMMGGSIKKTCADLRRDGCKLIFCKNPFDDYIVLHKNKNINILKTLKMENIYRQWRTQWFEVPYYLETIENWRWLNDQIGQVTTTGLQAIADIYRFQPERMHLAGFDFFSSAYHYGYPVHLKPWPKHHDFKGEMLFAKKFLSEHKNITCDDVMRKIFAHPEKFPKIGSKPE